MFIFEKVYIIPEDGDVWLLSTTLRIFQEQTG